MNIQNMKEAVKQSIDQRAEEIVELAKTIYENPETGYKEYKTAKLVASKFEEWMPQVTVLRDIPGVKVTLDTGRPGPGVAIMGELDALVVPDHPDADPVTGAVHACGHNMQIATMVGAFLGFMDNRGLLDQLCGKIHFMAIPAEECIELGFRKELREKGIIRYFSGKPEFLHRGLFDDVNLAILMHSFVAEEKLGLPDSLSGLIVKRIRYIGKASHAGGAPEKGINALYAANLGLMAINSLREGFKESDFVRVHPVITKGGDGVNVIPSEVLVETFVRGKTVDVIEEINRKVDRALFGGAVALGAQVEIENLGGYMPLATDERFSKLGRKIMGELVSAEEIFEKVGHTTASSDMGDLSTLMPVFHPGLGGVRGVFHSTSYEVVEPEIVVLGAKFLACSAIELLADQAGQAKTILENYEPVFKTKEEFLQCLDGWFSKRLLSLDDGALF